MRKFSFVLLMFIAGAFLAASTPADLESRLKSEPVIKSEPAQELAQEPEVLAPPVPSEQWGTQTKVWLARSCVGESGFFNTEECIAIAWVYATRAKEAGWPFIKMTKKYSAALKRHKRHRRPWIFQLNASGRKPKSWPDGVMWSRYKGPWLDILAALDEWQAGKMPNPVPGANHFGSPEDERASVKVRGWLKMDTPDDFENLFFDSSGRGEVVSKLVRDYDQYMLSAQR